MSRLSLPQRAVWPKLLPGFPFWSGMVAVFLGGLSLFLIGIPDLNWWIKVSFALIALVFPILVRLIWKYPSIMWQRVKQYDFLYGELERTASNDRQLQENFTFILQKIIMSAGLQVFGVTGVERGNRSPLLVIDCNQQVPIGSKLVVINTSTLDTLGRFEVEQATRGGYLAREDWISNPVWWGLLHNQVDISVHSRIDDAVAVLLR